MIPQRSAGRFIEPKRVSTQPRLAKGYQLRATLNSLPRKASGFLNASSEVKLSSSDGSAPEKVLSCKRSTCRPDKSPNCEGSDPDKRFMRRRAKPCESKAQLGWDGTRQEVALKEQAFYMGKQSQLACHRAHQAVA